MKKTFLLILLSFPLALFAQCRMKSASVTFIIRNAGIAVEGKLEGLTADIHFDPRHPESSSIFASADAATIQTGIKLRDSHVKGEEYLDAAKYPKITMRSRELKANGTSYTGIFDITIKNTTKSVILPFTYTETSDAEQFKGSFSLNRRDFGVGKNSFILSDTVIIQVLVNATH